MGKSIIKNLVMLQKSIHNEAQDQKSELQNELDNA